MDRADQLIRDLITDYQARKWQSEPMEKALQIATGYPQSVLQRCPRADGKIGNYLAGGPIAQDALATPSRDTPINTDQLSEDALKTALQAWLEGQGWKVKVVWGRGRGIDIEAERNERRWVIEVKGRGSLSAMRVNYFLTILGELLQRMSDPTAKYSIALPDLAQYRGLWKRLPELAKTRTRITALFVDEHGRSERIDGGSACSLPLH